MNQIPHVKSDKSWKRSKEFGEVSNYYWFFLFSLDFPVRKILAEPTGQSGFLSLFSRMVLALSGKKLYSGDQTEMYICYFSWSFTSLMCISAVY